MKRVYIFGFLALLFFETMTQICTKYVSATVWPIEFEMQWLSSVLSDKWLYLTISGYLGSFFCWMTLLRSAPVGPSFAASHLEIVTVAILSIWLFDEPMNIYKVIGGLCILGGVFCLAKGEAAIEKEKTSQNVSQSLQKTDGRMGEIQ